MDQMVKKFLQILALIDAYKYFQSKNEMITDENVDRFLFVVNNDYIVRINKFMNDLKSKMKDVKNKN